MIVDLCEAPSIMSQVAQWQFGQWGHLYPGQTVHDRLAALQLHLGHDPLPTTFVAFHNDFPAGCVSLVERDLEEYPALSPWLASLYVVPHLRSKGIGGALVKQLEQFALESGYESLYLHTSNAMEYFWDRTWEPVHNLQRPTGQVMVMLRDLTAPPESTDETESSDRGEDS